VIGLHVVYVVQLSVLHSLGKIMLLYRLVAHILNRTTMLTLLYKEMNT